MREGLLRVLLASVLGGCLVSLYILSCGAIAGDPEYWLPMFCVAMSPTLCPMSVHISLLEHSDAVE